MNLLAKLPRFSMMCCCIPLRTGSILLAVVQVLACLISIFQLAFTDPQDTLIVKDLNQTTQHLDINHINGSKTSQETLELGATVVYSSLLGDVICLTFAVILLVGAFQRNVLLLKFYVLFNYLLPVMYQLIFTTFGNETTQNTPNGYRLQK
uniref:CSON002712 protein n=1 Tax=Culicoides sonorensis TaxID=179676 RepID=A0A336MJQ1_CULSO